MKSYPNAADHVGLTHVMLLGSMVIFVAVVAVWRLWHGTGPVEGVPVLIVSALAVGVTLVCALILPRNTGSDEGSVAARTSLRGILRGSLGGSAPAAAMAATAGVVLARGGWYWLDPVVALVIVGRRAFRRRSG